MKSMIPEFNISQHQLFFNATESLYKIVEEDEEEPMDPNDGHVHIRLRQPRVEIYSNQATSKRITQQEFMEKEYLIEDSLRLSPWKFGAETKMVMGQECKQAMFYNEERKQHVVAWYTPLLRPFLGPEIFNTLPGTVLEVNLNDGERILTAKSFESRRLKKNELKAPHQGTEISQAEFRKMVDKQRERMGANGANVIIRN